MSTRNTKKNLIHESQSSVCYQHGKVRLLQSEEMILSLHNGLVSTATCLARVESLIVLGVTFHSKLRFDSHIAHIIDNNLLQEPYMVYRPFELMVLLGNLCAVSPTPH